MGSVGSDMGMTTFVGCWKSKVDLKMKVEKVELRGIGNMQSAAVEVQLMGPRKGLKFGLKYASKTKKVMFDGGGVAMIGEEFPPFFCRLSCVAKIYLFLYADGKKKSQMKAASLYIGGLAAKLEKITGHKLRRAIPVRISNSSKAIIHLSAKFYDKSSGASSDDYDHKGSKDETSKRGRKRSLSSEEGDTDQLSLGSKKRKTDQGQELNKLESGKWVKLAVKSGKVKLNTDAYFASLDQTSNKAEGNAACAVLATYISDWLLSNPDQMPTRDELDDLIIKGSAKWRLLCREDLNVPDDKFFFINTILERKDCQIRPSWDRSSVIDLEKFKFLDGKYVSFNNTWADALGLFKGKELVFIVNWDAHFFVIKIGADESYLIDTLGMRLFNDNKRAYMLKFDASSRLELLADEEDDELFEGRDCLKEFITKFLAGRTVAAMEAMEVSNIDDRWQQWKQWK